jgi:hypothetical protein
MVRLCIYSSVKSSLNLPLKFLIFFSTLPLSRADMLRAKRSKFRAVFIYEKSESKTIYACFIGTKGHRLLQKRAWNAKNAIIMSSGGEIFL